MRNLLLGAVLGLGLVAGCGSSGNKYDEAIAGVKGAADKMCACKDAACAAQVTADYEKFRDDMEARMKGTKPADGQFEALEAAEGELHKCEAKLKAGGASK